MPSIADYPQRLNLAPFQQTRLTELDAGLFAQLGYLNFNYLIGQPYARFADLNDSSRLNKATLTTWAIPTHQAMLQAMRQSARFARVTGPIGLRPAVTVMKKILVPSPSPWRRMFTA